MDKLGSGSFGVVYDAVVVNQDGGGSHFVPCHDLEISEVVIKAMTTCPENENEVNLIRNLQRRNLFGFTQLVDHGEIDGQSRLYARDFRKFIVMEKLGNSLKDFYVDI